MANKYSILTGLALALTLGQVHATVYTLTADGCSGTCGTGPFGTVSVVQDGAGLDFTVDLTGGAVFHDTNDSQHHALVFDLSGSPTITISGLPLPFTANGSETAGSNSAAPFGSFEYVINYPHHTGGAGDITSFSFLATKSGGLTLASLTDNPSNGIYFATDILGNNGNTGNVGAVAPASVPEPENYALMLAGFGLVGLVARRRHKAC